MIETKRLILRPWKADDAEELYKYACDTDVGPVAGWQPHTSMENSLDIIRTVFSAPETYAVVLKETGKPVGGASIMFEGTAPIQKGEAEIGYWIGKPYWGQGLIPEAVNALLKRCFKELDCIGVWCGYYNDNEKSKRVQEKCGFIYHHTEENKPCILMNDIRTEHFTYMKKTLWQDMKKIRKAKYSDLPELTRIYNYEVKNGVSTLDLKPKTLKEREVWFYSHNIKNHPLIVLEDEGKIMGYASLSPYREKEAYKGTVEISVYVSEKHRNKGVATALMNKILVMARRDKSIHTIVSVITSGNYASRRLHEKFGFEYCGTIKKVGIKFGEYRDIDNFSLRV